MKFPFFNSKIQICKTLPFCLLFLAERIGFIALWLKQFFYCLEKENEEQTCLMWAYEKAQCLKITEKVAFSIASEASYVYILSGQKFYKNAKNGQFWRVFENSDLCWKIQTRLFRWFSNTVRKWGGSWVCDNCDENWLSCFSTQFPRFSCFFSGFETCKISLRKSHTQVVLAPLETYILPIVYEWLRGKSLTLTYNRIYGSSGVRFPTICRRQFLDTFENLLRQLNDAWQFSVL